MKIYVAVILAGLLVLSYEGVRADNIFIDSEDGYVDASRWLLEHSGFLPVPIIITEPAVGFGGGVALIFMDRNKDPGRGGHLSPPTIKGIAAFGTENGSKGAAGFYKRSWDNDSWRYQGILGVAGMNLSFYGSEGFPGGGDVKLDYNLDGYFIFQDIRRRLGDSDWFLGLRYSYSQITASFDGTAPPALDSSMKNNNAGLTVLTSFDNRDNTMSPQEGLSAELRYNMYSEAFGGQLDYNIADLDVQDYWKFNEKFGGAVRLLVKDSDGDTPFYAKPYIDLRGIAKQRYQGDEAGSLELELRWNPELRWQYIVFGGAGKAHMGGLFDDDETAGTYGLGFRYLMARLVGFRMGLDVARGPEESVFYIQAGGSW
jgi:hypothetical protein